MNLDMDVLRTLAAAMELGGFGKAAEAIGRSQSAVSLQIRRLEEQVGRPLFRKDGRRLALTEAGELILSYGNRILQLNDEAIAAARGVGLQGSIRLGLPADLAETFFPATLAHFTQRYPHVHVEARVDRNTNLLEQASRGALDLALVLSRESTGGQEIAHLPICWIGARNEARTFDRDVPLLLFDTPCLFREAGLSALERAKLAWRIALTSPSLSGLWAATEAGLGISVRTALGLPPGLKVLGNRHALPELNAAVSLSLHSSGNSEAAPVRALREIIISSLADLVRAQG